MPSSAEGEGLVVMIQALSDVCLLVFCRSTVRNAIRSMSAANGNEMKTARTSTAAGAERAAVNYTSALWTPACADSAPAALKQTWVGKSSLASKPTTPGAATFVTPPTLRRR